jgi:raffinose/stachyose/melibiose transport system substrate-binding protein
MKKLVALLLTAVMSIGMLAGCGSKTTDTPATGSQQAADTTNNTADTTAPALSGEIVVASNRTDLEDTLNAYAKTFMAANPGTTVTFEFIKEYDDVVATRIAGGEAPDLFYVVNPINQDTYSEYFLPIDDLPFTADDILFYENGRGADGKLYVLPLDVSYCGMIYNKQAFKAAGITEIPKTVDEFYAVCDKLQAAGITPVGTAFKDVWPIFAWCGWGEVTLSSGDNRGENKYADQDQIYDETMINSISIVRELNKKGQLEADIMSANWDQFKLDLAQGKVAMHYSETWLPIQFVDLGAKQEDIGMFPMPGAKNIKAGGGKGWGVSKDTENPELAKAFLTHMLNVPFTDAEIPSNMNLEVTDPFVGELLSYGVEPLSPIVGDARFSNIRNAIELDGQQVFLSYVLEKDDAKAQAMLDEWNAKWAAERVNW